MTLVEQRRDRFERLEDEFEHVVVNGDATELFVLERAGIQRPPSIVVAVTGDDEDNIVICQLAREKYGVEKVIARVNDPRNQVHFDLLGVSPTVCATSSIMALIEHEVPEHGLVHLLELPKENVEIVEVQIPPDADCAGTPIEQLAAARGLAADLGQAQRPVRDRRRPTTLAPGDQVLAILQPGKEDELRRVLLATLASPRSSLVAARLLLGAGRRRRARWPARSSSRAASTRRRTSTAPASEPGRLYVVEQRGTIARRRRTAACARSRSSTSAPRLERRRAGAALGRVPPALRAEPPLLRRLHRHERGHARGRVPLGRDARAIRRSARQLFFEKQPFPNHNGGQLAFGPDGLLYIGMGDGGSGGDPNNNGQTFTTKLGEALEDRRRHAPARSRSSSTYGLRNPWRFSFDRANGDLYIGDVGQGAWEEIDYVPRARLGTAAELRLGGLRGPGAVRLAARTLDPRGPYVGPIQVYSPRRSAARSPAASSTAGRRVHEPRRPLLLRRLLLGHGLEPEDRRRARRPALRRESVHDPGADLVRRGRARRALRRARSAARSTGSPARPRAAPAGTCGPAWPSAA